MILKSFVISMEINIGLFPTQSGQFVRMKKINVCTRYPEHLTGIII